MNFSEQLNEYIKQLDCSSKDLVEASGVSSTVISRYRNGERTPNIKSLQLEQISKGLAEISKRKNLNLQKDDIYISLSNTLGDVLIDFNEISKNFNELISTLNINLSKLSRAIDFDASFLSKIRTGNRKPSNPQDFINAVCNFVVFKYNSINEKKLISTLIKCSLEDLSTDSSYFNKLKTWFSTNSIQNHNYINNFLENLNTFDLNEYIKAIHFDELKVPSLPFYKHSNKSYYGIEEMKKGELDFFKSTVLSKSNEPVFMCSDMPMEDMAKDVDFGKKWMYAIAMTLKKGLHLNIIHNIDRPFNEMMLGLESWIPIYMTGQVSPYYLKGLQNVVYCHFNYVSGNVALTGECIKDYHYKGKYYLTTNKDDVSYYKSKAKYLLNKATPLMEIYRENSKVAFNTFLTNNSNAKGSRKRILSSLPIHTISETLLLKILKRNSLSSNKIEEILDIVNNHKKMINNILKSNCLTDEILEITKDTFEKENHYLFLADGFCQDKISYTYDEYLEHLKLTKIYEKNNLNYSLKTDVHTVFKNIQISIHEGKWVMISKNTNPTIHFVIKHPKLRNAIENFVAPIIE